MKLMPRTRRRRDPAQVMSIVEHLEELRSRIIVSLIAVGVGATIGWVFFHPIFDFAAKKGLVVTPRAQRRFNALMVKYGRLDFLADVAAMNGNGPLSEPGR